MDEKKNAMFPLARPQIAAAQLLGYSGFEFIHCPGFCNLDLDRHTGVRSSAAGSNVGLLFPHHMRLTLDRIGPPLFPAETVGYPILDIILTGQERKCATLGKIAVQKLMLPILEAFKKQPLKIERGPWG